MHIQHSSLNPDLEDLKMCVALFGCNLFGLSRTLMCSILLFLILCSFVYKNYDINALGMRKLFSCPIAQQLVQCEVTWDNGTMNFHGGGAQTPGVTVTSLDQCREICENTTTCYSIDWNPGLSTPCWLFYVPNPATGPIAGVDHYRVIGRYPPGCNSQFCFIVKIRITCFALSLYGFLVSC